MCVDSIKVTIGMCVRNCEASVKEAINSVFDQDFSYDATELIVVDGCSQDRTMAIVKNELKEAGFDAKIFCEDKGLGKARQIVVDNAEGEYIVWVDGDMVLLKDFVRKQVRFMDEHPDVGIAKGRYGNNIDGNSKKLVAVLENLEFMIDTMSTGEADSRVLGTSGCIYRLEAIRETGGFDTNIKGAAEDMDIERRIRYSGWGLQISPPFFNEIRRQDWGSLWKEYYWHGRGNRHIFEKDGKAISLQKFLPPIALANEFLRVNKAYKLTHRKVVLLLPLHYIFKRIAWLLGFVKG